MIKSDFQKIADSFSIGKIISTQQIKKPLSLKTKSVETKAGLLSLFRLSTNHENYVLAGVSQNTINKKRLEQKLKNELELTYLEFLKTKEGTFVTHKNNLWWYLTQPFKIITKNFAIKKIFSYINSQQLHITAGYGGILFIGIGEAIKPEITWASGEPFREMEFFVDEWWEIWRKDKKIASRFEDELADKFIKKINDKKITDFKIQPSFKKTIISVGDHDLVIYRTEELITWDFRHRINNFQITLSGRKKLQIKDHIFEKPGQTTKKHKSFQPTIFDQFYKENLPISVNNVKKLIKPVLDCKILEVREYTGISFGLSLLGNDEWLLIINSEWELTKKNKSILSSASHRFAFIDQLSKLLINNKLKSINFGKNQTSFFFENKIEVKVFLKKKRWPWSIFNHKHEFHIDATRNGNFTHIIICPQKLREKYLEPQYGSGLANSLYALDFYRNSILSKD